MESEETGGEEIPDGENRERNQVGEPEVSFVVPARNEEDYLPICLRSIRSLETEVPYELIVSDGGSTDSTKSVAKSFGAKVIEGGGKGIGHGRHRGAEESKGDWIAFIDADTVVKPNYLEEMLSFIEENGLIGATSRCRMTEAWRSKIMEATINYFFPYLRKPVLPGFNFFVDRETYFDAGGFPNVPNEDTAFSRKLGSYGKTAYHPEKLVETSGRRIKEKGLTRTAYHYIKLDIGRLRADY